MFIFGVVLVRISPAFSAFGLNTERYKHLSVLCPNAGECGKNVDQNNSEYEHFYALSFLMGSYLIFKRVYEKKEENAPVTIRARVAFHDFVCSKGSDVVRM